MNNKQPPALVKPVEFNQEIPLTEPTSIEIPSSNGQSVSSSSSSFFFLIFVSFHFVNLSLLVFFFFSFLNY
jgi:hypothetical protein